MYRLDKRVISHFIRTGCRRRLRLDLYSSAEDRRTAEAPEKDAAGQVLPSWSNRERSTSGRSTTSWSRSSGP